MFCSAAPAPLAAAEFYLNTERLSRNQLCLVCFYEEPPHETQLRAGTTQTSLSMHMATWYPICCEGVLMAVKLSGLVWKGLFFCKEVHTVDRVESFSLLRSRLADPGTYIQGCLKKCRAVLIIDKEKSPLTELCFILGRKNNSIQTGCARKFCFFLFLTAVHIKKI